MVAHHVGRFIPDRGRCDLRLLGGSVMDECVTIMADIRGAMILGWLILCVGYTYALLLEKFGQ